MAAIAYVKLSKLTELLRSLEGEGMLVRIASSSKLSIGKDPMNPEAIVDLAKEVVITRERVKSPTPANYLKIVV